MKNFFSYLRQKINLLHPIQWFIVTILVFTMVNNIDHLAQTYYDLNANSKHSESVKWFLSYFTVLIFDCSVLAYVMLGSITESAVSAVVILLVNYLFHDLLASTNEVFGIGLTFPEIKAINRWISIIIYGAMFAYTIERFAILFRAKQKVFSKLKGLYQTIEELQISIYDLSLNRERDVNKLSLDYEKAAKTLQKQVTELSHTNEQLSQDNDTLKSKIEHLHSSVREHLTTNAQLQKENAQLTDDYIESKISLTRHKDSKTAYQMKLDLIENMNDPARAAALEKKVKADFEKKGKTK